MGSKYGIKFTSLRKTGCLIWMFVCLCYLELKAQGWLVEENKFGTNWNVSLHAGAGALVNEIRNDFSGTYSPMNNNPGFAARLSLSKMAFDRFDAGISFGINQFAGSKSNPMSIPYLSQHPKFNSLESQFVPYPVRYQTNMFSVVLFSKYNFINFSTFARGYISLNMYVKAGIGAAYLFGNLSYTEPEYHDVAGIEAPLHAINRYGQKSYTPALLLNTAMGINYQVTPRLFLSAEFSLQTIGSSLVDALPNYSDQLMFDMPENEISQTQIPVFGFGGSFMLGTTYFFNFNSQNKKQLKYMPFYHSRYRSYYSRFHTAENKRGRKLRLPFSKLK